MTLFAYRAIDDDGRDVTGTIDAPDIDAAATALDEANLEVTQLQEAARLHPLAASQNASEAELPIFAFEGKDAQGSLHRGTFQAGSKREVFDRLSSEQGLRLSVLTPMGVPPPEQDGELAEWQRTASRGEKGRARAAAPDQFPDRRIEPAANQGPVAAATARQYLPLTSTLRLYFGWLLAWYGLFVGLGHYVHVRRVPVDVPFVEGFYLSPLIFSFVVAIVLFLLLHSLHRTLRGSWLSAIGLLTVGLLLFSFVRWNVQ